MAPVFEQFYKELFEYAKKQPKINTHCHQLPAREFHGFDLNALLRNSYINWVGVPWDGSAEARTTLLERIRFNSAFVWLQKSLCELYESDEALSGPNWQAWNQRIQAAYRDASHPEKILLGQCAYRKMVLDAYWNPGSANDRPDVFMPTFRVNSFFFGYSTIAADHDGNNPYVLYPRDLISDLDEYVAWFRDRVLSQKEAGCVALKLPIAYDRGLDFGKVTPKEARQAFSRLTATSPKRPNLAESSAFPTNAPVNAETKPVSGADPADVKTFQDYLFFQLCSIAADANLPLQIHTGTGQGFRTNAAQLREPIQKFPETRFVLLHCSYPWIEDMSLLVTGYPNVYPDLSMVPLYSTQAAKGMLNELIERSIVDKVCWGCDTWTPEESYGSLLAFCHVLALTLAGKTLEGYISSQDAFRLIDLILLDNPHHLYAG